MTEREALKLALEALEANQPINYCMNNNGEKFPMMQEDPFRFERNIKAITAIKQALAQPEQEPRNISERWNIERDGDDLLVCFNDHEKSEGCRYERYVPAKAQPEQEPVGTVKELFTQAAWEKHDLRGSTKVYTTPPHRKPLTDEEIDVLVMDSDGTPNSHLEFARAIEAAHGIKE